jgi:hypothetical protein
VSVVPLMACEPHSAVQVYRSYTDQDIGYPCETIIDNFLSIRVNFVAVISVKAISVVSILNSWAPGQRRLMNRKE